MSPRLTTAPNSKPLRIAMVSDAVYPYNKGGKETRLYQLSTGLAKAGHDVHIYTMKWWTGAADKDENGVHLHAICPLFPLYDGERRSIKQGILFGLACFKLISQPFNVAEVDHMPFFPIYSMRVVCWLKRVRMLATWHEVWGPAYWQEYLGGWKGVVAAQIERWSVNLADQVVAVSQLTASKLVKLGRTKPITVIPNGIDLEAIKRAPVSPLKSDVIFVGRLLKHKHVDVLLEAVALLAKTQPGVVCRIVGQGPEEDALRAQAKRLGLGKQVVFHPDVPDDNAVYGLLKASKVFVLPSTREGFGITVLEAAACGLRIITTDHPDNAARELVGELIKSGNTSELSNRILMAKYQKKLSAKELSEYNWRKIGQALNQEIYTLCQ